MTFTEGLLIVIVIILTVLLCKRGRGDAADTETKSYDCVDKATGAVTSVSIQRARADPESVALAENAEHFATADLSNICEDGDAYATNLYGAAGLSYKDYIMNMSVDSQIVQNHSNFVKQQSGSESNILGVTKCMGTLDDTSQINYVGLMRPSAIPMSAMGNPTQISDVRSSDFKNGPSLVWNTNGTQ